MSDAHQLSVAGERQIERVARLSEIISEAEASIIPEVDALLAKLTDEGALRIHRDWSTYRERLAIAKTAAAAAVQSVLTCGWVDLPAEVEALHVVRKGEA